MTSAFKAGIRSNTALTYASLVGLLIAVAVVLACGGDEPEPMPSETGRPAQAAPTAVQDAGGTPEPASVSPSPTAAAVATATASVPEPTTSAEQRAGGQAAATPTEQPTAAVTSMATAEPIPTATPEPVATPVATLEPVPAPGRPTVVATATEVPAPTATPAGAAASEGPLREYTPEEIGAVDWRAYEAEGYPYRWTRRGQKFWWYDADGGRVEMTCGPEIGSSLDARTSQTWTEHSHLIWLWYVDPDARQEVTREGCVLVSKYEDWPNKPVPRPQLKQHERNPQRVKMLGVDLVFFHDVEDRSYTMPPGNNEYGFRSRPGGSAGSPDSDYFELCFPEEMPNALWTDERGFVGVPDADVVRYYDLVADDAERIAEVERARAAGWFYVYFGEFRDDGCWQIGNPEEVPEEPCLECDMRRAR